MTYPHLRCSPRLACLENAPRLGVRLRVRVPLAVVLARHAAHVRRVLALQLHEARVEPLGVPLRRAHLALQLHHQAIARILLLLGNIYF